MKKILIIDGHPDDQSFNNSISEAYKVGAIKSGAEVKTLRIADLQFDPNLKFGYRKRMDLESDLLESQEK